MKRNLALPKRADCFIGHTRFATKGEPEVNANNHPIPQGTIVGVHNGVISNDERLWGDVVKATRRNAQVDSEVIFAMLAHGWKDSGANVTDVLEVLKGNAAVAWLDKETPGTMYLARAYGSPLFIGQTEGGSVIFASEAKVVTDAASAANLALSHVREANEGSLFTVVGGDITNVRTFKPSGPSYTSYRNAYDEYDWNDTPPRKSARESAKAFTAIDGTEEMFDAAVFNTRTGLTPLDRASYYQKFQRREEEIDDWFSDFKGDSDQLQKAAERMKCFVEPGEFVLTDLMGKKRQAQVVTVPNTFPQGKYVLRVFINKGAPAEHGSPVIECVLAERMWFEFDTDGLIPQVKAVTAVDPLVKDAVEKKRIADEARDQKRLVVQT